MTLKTDLGWKPELTGWDRVCKADWAFYKDVKKCILKPGRVNPADAKALKHSYLADLREVQKETLKQIRYRLIGNRRVNSIRVNSILMIFIARAQPKRKRNHLASWRERNQ
jgi:hypothetical protein